MPDTKYEAEKIEAQKRFDALPETLKKEMLADKNVELISSVCRDYSIPENKTKHIALLVGEVFLGYMKPEEIAHELNTYFDIDLQKSNFIEIELKQKLFNGLKADLDKIYNPLSAEASAKTEALPEEVSPTIIELEKEAAPISSASAISFQRPSEIITEKKPGVKVSPLTIGNIPTQPTPPNQAPSSAPLSEAVASEQNKPFIIQTKAEAVKAAIPQFPRESPSLNLKVDPSIIQKSPIVKPISVHLETAQPVQEKRFQMPVIAGQKIFSSTSQTEIKPKEAKITPPSKSPDQTSSAIPKINQNEIKPAIQKQPDIAPAKTVKIPIQEKTIKTQPPQPLSSPSLKEISEQKTISPLITPKSVLPEPPKVVHYSNFKTDLTQFGAPKKPGPIKDGFINLNTFTKVSGNTVDLRKSS